MLAAVRAKTLGCSRSIVLINDPSLIPLIGAMGIDSYINPRSTTVSSILRHIRHGRVKDVYSIGDAEAEIIEAEVLSTSPISGQKISDIEFPESVLIGGILKSGVMQKPTGSTRIEEGDIIAFFVLSKDIVEMERLLQVSIDFFLIMIWHFSKLPILLQMFWVGALLMWIPAIHGTIVGNFDEARNFFYGGLLGLFFVYMLALAQSNRTAIASRFQLLIMLVLGYVFYRFIWHSLIILVSAQHALRRPIWTW